MKRRLLFLWVVASVLASNTVFAGLHQQTADELVRQKVIEGAFFDCLGHPPTAAQLAYHMNGEVATQYLAAGICTGAEARMYAVQQAFVTCIGQYPTETQITTWMSQAIDIPGIYRGICASPQAKIWATRQNYLKCLYREATQAEIDDWSNRPLDSNGIATGICTSVEGQRVSTIVAALATCANVDPVTRAHIDAWYGNPVSNAQLREDICNSEPARLYTIHNAFQTCIGLAPTQAQITTWLATPTRDGIWDGICDSPQARQQNIVSAYGMFLGRLPTPTEIAYWMAQPGARADISERIRISVESLREILRWKYWLCLFRFPTEAELDAWVARAGERIADQNFFDICDSPEATLLNASHAAEIDFSIVNPAPFDVIANNSVTVTVNADAGSVCSATVKWNDGPVVRRRACSPARMVSGPGMNFVCDGPFPSGVIVFAEVQCVNNLTTRVVPLQAAVVAGPTEIVAVAPPTESGDICFFPGARFLTETLGLPLVCALAPTFHVNEHAEDLD